MSLFAKIMVVVNLVLAVAFLPAAGTLLGAMNNWKGKHAADTKKLQDDNAALTEQVTQRDTQIANEKEARQTIAGELAASQALLQELQDANQTLNDQMSKEQAALAKLTETYADVEARNTQLQTANGQLTEQLNAAKGDAASAREEGDNLRGEVARLTQALSDAESALAAQQAANTAQGEQIDSLKMQLALYQKHYPTPDAVAMTKAQGVVQAVDNEMDIFIISVGSKDGVKVGYEFTVYRGSEYVSTIVVDKVFDTHASARTRAGLKKSNVRAGDEVSNHM